MRTKPQCQLEQPQELLDRVYEIASHDDVPKGVLLGRGGFNSVYQVMNRKGREGDNVADGGAGPMMGITRRAAQGVAKACSMPLAIKCPIQSVLDKGGIEEAQVKEDLRREAEILLRLPEHDHIIQIYGVSSGLLTGNPGSEPFIVLEGLKGTLNKHLRRLQAHRDSNLISLVPTFALTYCCPEHKDDQNLRVRTLGVGIARALVCLHQHRFIHRDLKTANMGFSPTTGRIKLFDFGLSRSLDDSRALTQMVGTPRLMAPEVRTSTQYDTRCDVFSFGLFLSELCTFRRVEAMRPTTPVPWIHSPQLRQVVLASVRRFPTGRPSMKEVLERLERTVGCTVD